MKVVKFGGTSVANATNIQKAVQHCKEKRRTANCGGICTQRRYRLLIKTGTLAEENDEQLSRRY